ncbi:acyl carrier protein, partial [Streptomyces aculeolatus]
ANTYLDTLAHHRHTQGLPATSLAWGLWGEAGGMQDSLSDTDLARMAGSGMRPISPDEGMALLDAALRSGLPALVPIKFDLPALRAKQSADAVPPLLSRLVGPSRRAVRRNGHDGGSLARRLAPLSAGERAQVLIELVSEQAAAVLGLADAETVEAEQAFKDLGFDSLTAVELRNHLTARTGIRLPATLVFDHPTPAALAERIGGELFPEAVRPREERRPDPQPAGDGSGALIAEMAVEDLVARALGGTSQ